MGWGPSTWRGGGQKVRYVPRNPGNQTFLAGYPGILPGYPGSARKVWEKNVWVQFLAPIHAVQDEDLSLMLVEEVLSGIDGHLATGVTPWNPRKRVHDFGAQNSSDPGRSRQNLDLVNLGRFRTPENIGISVCVCSSSLRKEPQMCPKRRFSKQVRPLSGVNYIALAPLQKLHWTSLSINLPYPNHQLWRHLSSAENPPWEPIWDPQLSGTESNILNREWSHSESCDSKVALSIDRIPESGSSLAFLLETLTFFFSQNIPGFPWRGLLVRE